MGGLHGDGVVRAVGGDQTLGEDSICMGPFYTVYQMLEMGIFAQLLKTSWLCQAHY